MKRKSKKLSNPFSTGGGGPHFEAHVQASFVILMLTGGYVPYLSQGPIVEIKFQGKIDGFDTDDLIVFVENRANKKRYKLLGQIKHSIAFTKSDKQIEDVLHAAWNDFNNPKIFVKGQDIIALITGPINKTDQHNMQWLLDQAKHTKDSDEFLTHVKQSNFSPTKSLEKLEVIQYCLKKANNGVDVQKEQLYNFLKHFYLLGYDLGHEGGVVLSLLNSHIAQFGERNPKSIWTDIVDIVHDWNENGGTITVNDMPEDIFDYFRHKPTDSMPDKIKPVLAIETTDWSNHPDATYLALANLIGSWDEKNENDIHILTQQLGIDHDTWFQKAREILQHPDSPLSLKNSIWKISNRDKLWKSLGKRVFDKNIDLFSSLTVSVLKEPDPAFELPPEKRYAARIYDKKLTYSSALRKGMAEGLAILGNNPEVFLNCSTGKIETSTTLTLRDIFTEADWILWGSLNDLLPTLGEAAPDEFLDAVEKTLKVSSGPFDQLFSQEGGGGITGSNYMTGLLWALERLAWDENLLARVCVVLGELSSHDPGGQWANRPGNSLVSILLPWIPRTMASVDKRKTVIQILCREWPDIAWELILQLLPNQHQTSFGTVKPKWRKIIPESWDERASTENYWSQVIFTANIAVDMAVSSIDRILKLIDYFNSLPEPAFGKFVETLRSPAISDLPEKERLPVWNKLIKMIASHKEFPDAWWVLPKESLSKIESVAEVLAPSNQFYLYQHLFSHEYFDLVSDKNLDYKEKEKKINDMRNAAVTSIFQVGGIDTVIKFAETVVLPANVGWSLSQIPDSSIEKTLLPDFLNSENKKRSELAEGYIKKKHYTDGWTWVDGINKANWSKKQIAHFFMCLPFNSECWERAEESLGKNQSEYWAQTGVNTYQAESNQGHAIDKLLEYGRPHAAISCLSGMRHYKQTPDTKQCIHALSDALSSKEPSHAIDRHGLIELIKFLQTNPNVPKDDLFKIEWAYLPILDRYHGGAKPALLESMLSEDAEFFCEVIQLTYRSKNEEESEKELSEGTQAIAENAWRLLQEWRKVPGTQESSSFEGSLFKEWLKKVKDISTKTGHLEFSLKRTGAVLIYSPADPDGLWVHRTVAEALNAADSEYMRDGYSLAIFNSRGVHTVDPEGKSELKLAAKYKQRAEEIENAGYHRLATTLRSVATDYENQAKRVIAEHN